jgi:hypothetical protein
VPRKNAAVTSSSRLKTPRRLRQGARPAPQPRRDRLRSRWDLVEYDGDRDELDAKHGIPRLLRRWLAIASWPAPGLQDTGRGAADQVQADADGAWSERWIPRRGAGWRSEHNVVYELNGTLELAIPRNARMPGARLDTSKKELAIAAGERSWKGNGVSSVLVRGRSAPRRVTETETLS